jgi:hypothetical protein
MSSNLYMSGAVPSCGLGILGSENREAPPPLDMISFRVPSALLRGPVPRHTVAIPGRH